MTKQNIYIARKFSNSFRYIDDLLMFNNDNLMHKYMNEIYPPELVLNKENKSEHSCTFLDMKIDIDIHSNKNVIRTDLYDKRDDFNFEINNFAILSGNIHFRNTHNIIISQLLRYCKVCNKDSFINKANNLIIKHKNQFFDERIIKQTCSFFFTKYLHMVEHYNVSRKHFIDRVCC